jgi:hypothetical protein
MNKLFRENGFTVERVREEFEAHPNGWYDRHVKWTVELADTWLHPFFREYDEAGVKEMLKPFPDVHTVMYNDKLVFTAMK